MQIVNIIGNYSEGPFVESGVLTMRVLPIVCAAVFTIVLVAILVKAAQKPKEDEDE